MAANFVPVDSIDTLDALFAESHIRPVVLFKHSNSCGISSHVFEQIGDVEGDVHVIVVQRDRPVSNAVAERTGYRHQSPQAFVIKDGKPVYHATHYGISAEAIEDKMRG